LCLYRVANKKWTVSFRCLQRVYHKQLKISITYLQYLKHYSACCSTFKMVFVSGSYLRHLRSTRMKPVVNDLLSNNLRKLCFHAPWWSTFFCATLYKMYILDDNVTRVCVILQCPEWTAEPLISAGYNTRSRGEIRVKGKRNAIKVYLISRSTQSSSLPANDV